MDQLLKLGTITRYHKGEILIRPTKEGGPLFIVVSGMVHAYTIEESGDRNIHYIYGDHDIFPVARIIKKELANVFYEALTDCEVMRLDTDQAIGEMKSEAATAYSVLSQVITQFIQYKARVDNLEYKYARDRIAYRLLLLAKRFGEPKDGKITMYRFSQEEISGSTNVSRESVGRELRRFERLGYIAYSGNTIEILQPDALRRELAPIDSPIIIDDL